MLATYPAIIHNDADGLWLEFVDFNCHTHADTIDELLFNAREAMECHLLGLLESGVKLPQPSSFNKPDTTLVQCDIDLGKHCKSVRKNLTIPAWLDEQATKKNINFSKVLQEALVAML